MELALFDFDGTLVDTLPDLHATLVALCRDAGRTPPDLPQTRAVVSYGVRAMLALAWNAETEAPAIEALRARFLEHYRAHLTRYSRLMPGVRETLETLTHEGHRWGIVTNKLASLTQAIVQALDFPTPPVVIVGADTAAHPKPHPAPLLHALSEARCQPEAALYIGDAQGDVIAGRAAGVTSLVALWGYLAPTDDPATWNAQGLLDRPEDLLAWFD